MKSEAAIQGECVMWLWNFKPETRYKLFEVNNNPLNKIDGARRKAMGMVAGVSDLIYLRDELPPLCMRVASCAARRFVTYAGVRLCLATALRSQGSEPTRLRIFLIHTE